MNLPTRIVPLCLLFLSATGDAVEIAVERDAEGVVVRSPIAEGNFLFRAAPAFGKTTPEEPFLVALQAEADGAKASIRLRIRKVTGVEVRAGMDRLFQGRAAAYKAGYDGKLAVSGEGARRLGRVRGPPGERLVLVVVDGDRLYELFLECSAPGSPLAQSLQATVDGFTVLDPKGAPLPRMPTASELKASKITHDYYRLTVLKPAGFTREDVDPDADKGIFLHLRKEDEHRNLCHIRIRVHLARAIKKSLEAKAQARIDKFHTTYTNTKGPKKPKRGSWPGAKNAYKFRLLGKAKHGIVIEEDWRIFEHKNGRLYEFQVTLYGAAAREFRKDLSAFWRSVKIKT